MFAVMMFKLPYGHFGHGPSTVSKGSDVPIFSLADPRCATIANHSGECEYN